MEVEESTKKGRKMPTYKLRSDLKQTTILRKVLEEKFLDNHVKGGARDGEERVS